MQEPEQLLAMGRIVQPFEAAGNAAGDQIQVNNITPKEQRYSSVATNANGEFVVSWASKDLNSGKYDIHVRRFDANGIARDAGDITVNSITDEQQLAPDVALDAAGNFVVAWQSKDLDYPDGDFGIYQRAFDADGTAVTAKQQLVNTRVTDHQSAASIAMSRDGSYVISWQSEKQDDPDNKFGVYAQRFAADGSPIGNEFRANSTTGDQQRAPAVAADRLPRATAFRKYCSRDSVGEPMCTSIPTTRIPGRAAAMA